MKNWQIYLCGVVFGLGFACGAAMQTYYCDGAATFSQESREHRQLELDITDVKSRLATLERIGVEIELIERSGMWAIKDLVKK
jgi:hypothetical protein